MEHDDQCEWGRGLSNHGCACASRAVTSGGPAPEERAAVARSQIMKNELSLYVWEDFSPDYTGGLAVAIAHDEAEARGAIVLSHGYNPLDWGTLTVHPLNRVFGVAVAGGA